MEKACLDEKKRREYVKPAIHINDPLTNLTFSSGTTTPTVSGDIVGSGGTIPGTGGSPGTVL